jgi:hypothetical protein
MPQAVSTTSPDGCLLVRGCQHRDDRHDDEHGDDEDEADDRAADPRSAKVRPGQAAHHSQLAVELLVPQVRAAAIGPAACRVRNIGRHGLSMRFETRRAPGLAS